MATRGEIYLLNMGEPIKIVDLAKTMARLHGREAYLAGEEAKLGGLQIRVTGLRPGEKLFEELLTDGTEAPTPHPRIMCEQSDLLGSDIVNDWLKSIRDCVDGPEAVALLRDLPLSYERTAA